MNPQPGGFQCSIVTTVPSECPIIPMTFTYRDSWCLYMIISAIKYHLQKYFENFVSALTSIMDVFNDLQICLPLYLCATLNNSMMPTNMGQYPDVTQCELQTTNAQIRNPPTSVTCVSQSGIIFHVDRSQSTTASYIHHDKNRAEWRHLVQGLRKLIVRVRCKVHQQ